MRKMSMPSLPSMPSMPSLPSLPSMPTAADAAAKSRQFVLAVMLGTALSAAGRHCAAAAEPLALVNSRNAPTLDEATIRSLARYCNACWRNARLPADDWADCTQQVLMRLLERLEPDQWAQALVNDDGEVRKEFVRAIDTVKKRCQRTRQHGELAIDVADHRDAPDASRIELREQVDIAAQEVLSPRQQRIVELCAGGWNVPEIADELKTTPERVSDEKYKAIRKLRVRLGVEA
jgi:RNA polymerase sigma factor (sigma-70 family)